MEPYTKKQIKAMQKARNHLTKAIVTLGHQNIYRETEFYRILSEAYEKMLACPEGKYVMMDGHGKFSYKV